MVKRFVPGPAALAVLLVAIPVALAPLKNADLFFHLAGAQWVLDHGAFPVADPWSFTAPHGWTPHEWGWGVLAELSVRAFGAQGPALLTGLSLAAFIALLWRALRREAQGVLPAQITVFAAAVASSGFTWVQERPFHLSHALFALALLAVQAFRTGRTKAVWLLAPLCAVWANIHASWLLAPALLGATLAGRAFDRRLTRAEGLHGALALIGCALAATLTPLGLAGLVYPIQHAALPSTRMLDEWRPLWFGSNGPSAFALVGLIVVALALAVRVKLRRWETLLPALGLAAAAVHAGRHQVYAAAALAVALAPMLPAAASSLWARWDRCGGLGWAAAVLCVLCARAWVSPTPVRDGLEEGLYPVKCLETLRTLPPGRVLNHFVLGGAVSYFAGAEHKVFIDGRNDPFPEDVHAAYRSLLTLSPGWERSVAQADYVLWFEVEGALGKLPLALEESGAWTVAARDNGGVLLVRKAAVASLSAR